MVAGTPRNPLEVCRMRSDLIGIIRNAMAKGEPIESISKSLTNSGYNQDEVNEAVESINSGVLQNTQSYQIPPSMQIQRKQTPTPTRALTPNSNQRPIPRNPLPSQKQNSVNLNQKKSGSMKTIILFGILLILIGILTLTILFRDKILSFFG